VKFFHLDWLQVPIHQSGEPVGALYHGLRALPAFGLAVEPVADGVSGLPP
jgi:hypothetical protein